jgi:hypothetical protein
VDILLILGGLLIVLVVASWSCANSYFEKGRLRGMEEARREIVRGLSPHDQLQNQTDPERVSKAIEGTIAASKKPRKTARVKPIIITRSFGYSATQSVRLVGSRDMLPA